MAAIPGKVQVFEIMERAKGFEPSTPTLARLCSTPELRPRSDLEARNYPESALNASACGHAPHMTAWSAASPRRLQFRRRATFIRRNRPMSQRMPAKRCRDGPQGKPHTMDHIIGQTPSGDGAALPKDMIVNGDQKTFMADVIE